MKEKLIKIIRHYSKYSQISKAVEELIELSELLIKAVNKLEINMDSLYEEMADVEIMLAQLKIIYGINDEVLRNYKEQKIDRTLKRIDAETDCAWK